MEGGDDFAVVRLDISIRFVYLSIQISENLFFAKREEISRSQKVYVNDLWFWKHNSKWFSCIQDGCDIVFFFIKIKTPEPTFDFECVRYKFINWFYG